MSKKQHPVSQVLKLIEGLDENERQIVRDFLRAPRQRPKSSSAASGAGKKSSSKKAVAPPLVQNTVGDLVNVSSAAGGD